MKSRFALILFSLLFLFQACCSDDSSVETKVEKSSMSEAEKKEYLIKGRDIAKATFLTLSTRLKAKIGEGGIQNAVEYCSLAAYPLTDSIASVNNVILRRTSDRYRNPENQPDSIESNIIKSYEADLKEGIKLKARIIEADGLVHFYAPIKTKGLCLSCHGEPGKFISKADYAFIKEKYPNDQAINYKSEDLRGIWSITFLEE